MQSTMTAPGGPFTIRDSGKREEFSGGMQRDTTEGKSRPDLVRDGPMFLRWVAHLTKGAIKYVARNWMKATGHEEYDRFLESTDRHYTIWYTWRKYGVNIEDANHPTTFPLTEDHAAALFFNVNGVEYLQEKMTIAYTTNSEEVSEAHSDSKSSGAAQRSQSVNWSARPNS